MKSRILVLSTNFCATRLAAQSLEPGVWSKLYRTAKHGRSRCVNGGKQAPIDAPFRLGCRKSCPVVLAVPDVMSLASDADEVELPSTLESALDPLLVVLVVPSAAALEDASQVDVVDEVAVADVVDIIVKVAEVGKVVDVVDVMEVADVVTSSPSSHGKYGSFPQKRHSQCHPSATQPRPPSPRQVGSHLKGIQGGSAKVHVPLASEALTGAAQLASASSAGGGQLSPCSSPPSCPTGASALATVVVEVVMPVLAEVLTLALAEALDGVE